jgi:hypothetical protein
VLGKFIEKMELFERQFKVLMRYMAEMNRVKTSCRVISAASYTRGDQNWKIKQAATSP